MSDGRAKPLQKERELWREDRGSKYSVQLIMYIRSYFLTPDFLAQQSGTTYRTGWCEIMSQRGLVQGFILLGPKLRHGTSYICIVLGLTYFNYMHNTLCWLDPLEE